VFCLNPTKAYEKVIKYYNKTDLKYSFINLLIEQYSNYVDDYRVPECVKRYTDEYLLANDSIRTFCEDHLTRSDPESFMLKADLKQLFADYKDDYSFGTRSALDFCKKVLCHIDGTFVRDKKIAGIHYNDVLLGWKIKAEREQADEF
jgi:phage/plasmid-associated DNA primase